MVAFVVGALEHVKDQTIFAETGGGDSGLYGKLVEIINK